MLSYFPYEKRMEKKFESTYGILRVFVEKIINEGGRTSVTLGVDAQGHIDYYFFKSLKNNNRRRLSNFVYKTSTA